MQRAFHLTFGGGISPLYQSKAPFCFTSSFLKPIILYRSRASSLCFSIPSLSSQSFLRFPLSHFRGLREIRMYAKGRDESRRDGDASISSAPVLPPLTYSSSKISFCQTCGGPTGQVIPDGEEKMRAVCTICGKIHYENPKMVVGCLVEHNDKVLLCKRNIEPSHGLWTLPAGYLEVGESAAEGATRETLEEALAEVDVISPFAQLDIPRIGQSYIIFRAKLKKPQFSPGPESSECALFGLDEIPLIL